MKRIGIIFRKELKDTLRDKRTLMTMLLVPLLMYPLLMVVISRVLKSQAEEALTKKLQIAFVDRGQGPELKKLFEDPFNGFQLNQYDGAGSANPDEITLRQLIRDKKIDGAVILDEHFDADIDSLKSGRIKLMYHSTRDMGTPRHRMEAVINLYKDKRLIERYKKLNVSESFVKVIDTQPEDVATAKEQQSSWIGAILPYFFIAFCLLGSMYPAIDLAAGEKERGTIETIITSPASRLEILLGKIGVVILGGLMSATVSIIGIFIAVRSADILPPDVLDTIYSMLQPSSVLLILLLLLPLAVFFASFLISISIYSKSFKEAQSIITPLIIVVVLPAFIGMLPGIELNVVTAAIPVLNVTLATKAIISDTIQWPLFVESMLSLLALAALSLYGAIRWFGRESNILRG